MKTIYQSPKVYILEIQASDHILLNTSETKIPEEEGGWVKEQDPTNPSKPHYNVWDDDWRDDEEKKNQRWR